MSGYSKYGFAYELSLKNGWNTGMFDNNRKLP